MGENDHLTERWVGKKLVLPTPPQGVCRFSQVLRNHASFAPATDATAHHLCGHGNHIAG